jgi:protein TonB
MKRLLRALSFAAAATLAACATPPLPPGAFAPDMPIDPAQVNARPVAPNAPGMPDVPARFISGNAPVYPITRLQRGEAGNATVDFTVAADGSTADVKVVQADYEYFGIHALIAVQRWRFEPARKDGRAVAMRVRQTFAFNLR